LRSFSRAAAAEEEEEADTDHSNIRRKISLFMEQ
jgi:hypothetical protein